MYGKKKMMKKGGKKKFPDLTGDGKVTRADILKGRGVFRKGGNGKVKEEKPSYVPQTQREKDYDYDPQSRRKQPQQAKDTMSGVEQRARKGRGTGNTPGKLEGSAKNFADIAARARKAKKPR